RQKPIGKTGGRAASRSSFGKSPRPGSSRFTRSASGKKSSSRSASARGQKRSFASGSGRLFSSRNDDKRSGSKPRKTTARGPQMPDFESEEAKQRWLKDRENYEFFHNISRKKYDDFDPANPSGFDDDDEDRRPERIPEPNVYESVKSADQPRGKRRITGFSANDNQVKRARKPLKRVLTDKSAQGRQKHREQLAANGGLKLDRPLPEMKHRAKAEKQTPKSGKNSKTTDSSADDGSGIRLQKILAAAGLGSRRSCEELISTGRVDVDGKTITELGFCVLPGQKVRVDGQSINQGKRHYFMLNKPEKFICTNADPDGRLRAIDLIQENIPGLYPVGRLDMSSTGLLLITNDGELANRLTHPSYEVQKIYRVHVSGVPTPEIIKKMCDGIYIAEGKVHADSAKIKQVYKNGTSIIEMVLSEGKNREIRRILARLGHNVLDLTRIAVGPVKLGRLPKGAYRRLTTAEIRQLKGLVGMQ
ncbi:MAG: rRNA pseudouridine synthase, partial [Thermoguttaceae bacterium]|nr:rRNA pseudouridine synthase [Thermoguttaceae bacterium]